VLIDDPTRFHAVRVLGIDEHVWRPLFAMLAVSQIMTGYGGEADVDQCGIHGGADPQVRA
jgi:hypothetical protein